MVEKLKSLRNFFELSELLNVNIFPSLNLPTVQKIISFSIPLGTLIEQAFTFMHFLKIAFFLSMVAK